MGSYISFWLSEKEYDKNSFLGKTFQMMVQFSSVAYEEEGLEEKPMKRWWQNVTICLTVVMHHCSSGVPEERKPSWLAGCPSRVICRDVDGPRDHCTEWSKSEREKQVSYNIAYMCNLEKWYRWTYLKSRNSLRCKDKYMVTKVKWRGDELEEWDWHI